MTKCQRRSAGFTLIEMIMVIVITGIIAGMVAVFITTPVQGYVDSVRRAELTDAADVALRRITRDVRLALPNSLRLKDSTNAIISSCAAGVECYVEFIITKWGGRYRDEADGSTGGNSLNFLGDTSFDVLGSAPGAAEMAANDHIVIYNLGVPGSDAYLGNNREQIQTPGSTVTLSASHTFPFRSPNARFQVVDNSQKVIRYGCVGGNLRRYANCSFTSTASCDADPPLIAQNASCVIDFQNNATGRNGLLYLQLTLTQSGESVTLFQQIHVDNAP